MIRSSAKNHAYVAVVVDPTDYEAIMEELEANDRTLSLQTRQRLAVKAFTHTAQYDTAISGYLSSVLKG
jgi:phosphoribosylaminoimidazolecarboxamide formyltransferase/IMP cyclohydrolase